MARDIRTNEGAGKVPPRAGKGRKAPNRRPPKKGRRGPNPAVLYGGVGVVVAVVVAVILIATLSGGSSGKPNAHQPAVNYTLADGTKVYGGLGPEHVPLELGPALASPNAGLTGANIDGIACNTSEQLSYHHHVHVALFVNGKPYSVPLGIGFVPPAQVENSPSGQFAVGDNTCLYWTHVHATDGIIHIESPEPKTLELGQIFDVWGIPLSPTQLGSYKGPVSATVNGAAFDSDPRTVPLQAYNQIVVNLGTPVVNPPAISWTGTGL